MPEANQRQLLSGIEWNNLIILDACRYDTFQRIWSRVEKVMEVISPASWTLEWLDRVFGNAFIDAEVFSATPYINSLTEINLYGIRWNAKKHFSKIIDLWLTAWDYRMGTVPPEKVYLAVVTHTISTKLMKKSVHKKKIIWFLQPHYPYISKRFLSLIKEHVQELTYMDFLTGKAERLLTEILKNIAIKNIDELTKAYEETLEKTLRYVYKLIDRLDGVTIVTSDHGELLGENILLQVLSTIINLMMQCIKEGTSIYISRRLRILTHLPKRILYNAKMNPENSVGASYIAGGKVFFHPPILYSTTLRRVPFVLIK
ncbi:MAG: hypothetical protein DRO13_05990 [Thermoprotei archaeon]|nr:MAG: hypothetical protein DRO13_05990 [Thermoprotei archaeon]